MATSDSAGAVNYLERIAGAVSGAAALLLKPRKTFLLDPADFDVDDVPDVTLRGPSADPGQATGYTRVRARSGAGSNVPNTRTLTAALPLQIDGANTAKDLSANRTFSIIASTTPAAGTVAEWGGSADLKAAFYGPSSGTPAGAGLLRGANATTLAAMKDSGGNDTSVIAFSGANLLTLGDTARVANMTMGVKTAGAYKVTIGSTDGLTVNESGVAVGGAPSFGGADHALFLANAGTPPSTNPVAGTDLYSSGGALYAWTTKTCKTRLAPTVTHGNTSVEIGTYADGAQTTDATPTVVLSVPLPTDCVATIDVEVIATTDTGVAGAWFNRVLRCIRDAGAASVAHTKTPTGVGDDNDTGLALSTDSAVSGGNVQLRVTGQAANTVDWFVNARVTICAP